jgi:hypothetical protein
MLNRAFKALDGGRFVATCPNVDVESAWYAVSWVDVGGQRTRVNGGLSGAFETVAPMLGEVDGGAVRLVEEATMNGRRLAVLESASQTTFLRQAPHHELTVTVPGVGASIDRFVAFLKLFDIVDDDDGTQLRPKLAATTRVKSQSATFVLSSGFAAQCMPTLAVTSSLPKHRGMQVTGGELWSIADLTGGPASFLLANSTATAVVSLAAAEKDAWVPFLQQFAVVYEAA